jgi:uncharacterized repeat protein (TIGR03803 family)
MPNSYHQSLCALMALAFLFGSIRAYAVDTYDPATQQLTIPTLLIGNATYSNVRVTIGAIVSGPTGSTPLGSEDRYQPGTRELAVQAVTVGSSTYYNVVASVSGLVSIGGVAGADTYDGKELSVSQVQSGGTVYGNVTVSETPGDVTGLYGGMPTAGPDTYNPISNQLSIPAVQFGNHVYTNVVVTAGTLQGVGGVSFRNQESIAHFFVGNADPAEAQTGVIRGADGSLYGASYGGGVYRLGTIFKVTPSGVGTVLHSFQGGTNDGSGPSALTLGSDGNIYGTTHEGGAHNGGTFFRMSPSGVVTLIYSFGGTTTDAVEPQGALVQDADGNWYGTAPVGGANLIGAVFKVTSAGVESVLYSFGSTPGDGASPQSIIMGSDGSFYGITGASPAGSAGTGTVFKLTPAGDATVLHSFQGGPADGSQPLGGLIQGSDGNFYGTTVFGGANNFGTVYRITPDGTESVLYSFGGGALDLGLPNGQLVQGLDGHFYGAAGGGTSGRGAVYEITPAGAVTVLYNFGSNPDDGESPEGPLIQDLNGNFYGTTLFGTGYYTGTVYKITAGGIGTVLYAFGTNADGEGPRNIIRGSDGNLYGITCPGGPYDGGIVFRITPAGVETALYPFGALATDASCPSGTFIQGNDGNFYGTASGGANGTGSIFELTPTGMESVLYSFPAATSGTPYPNPNSITQGSDGNFYGTTQSGGASGLGSVFKVTSAGAASVLHYFGGFPDDGDTPYAPLIAGNDGSFYGTTLGGGANKVGTVYRISPAGTESLLYSFGSSPTDAADPAGPLILGTDGSFYGTAAAGGATGNGAIFTITSTGVESVLYSFAGGPSDGASPAIIIQGSDGNFYGTTSAGGANSAGTVFKLTPTGVETVLYSFQGGPTDGSGPVEGLIQGSDGNFYGATLLGGIKNNGTIFRLTNVPPQP